jgi:hypothetical protein
LGRNEQSLTGSEGFRVTAEATFSVNKTNSRNKQLAAIPGFTLPFQSQRRSEGVSNGRLQKRVRCTVVLWYCGRLNSLLQDAVNDISAVSQNTIHLLMKEIFPNLMLYSK